VPPSLAVSPSPSVSPSAWPSPFPSHETVLLGDFRCTALGEARVHLAEAGLLLGATIPADPPPPEDWYIHDQLPPPGERVPVGSAVDFRLMDPQEPCPAS
jgi:hypothetical protein